MYQSLHANLLREGKMGSEGDVFYIYTREIDRDILIDIHIMLKTVWQNGTIIHFPVKSSAAVKYLNSMYNLLNNMFPSLNQQSELLLRCCYCCLSFLYFPFFKLYFPRILVCGGRGRPSPYITFM